MTLNLLPGKYASLIKMSAVAVLVLPACALGSEIESDFLKLQAEFVKHGFKAGRVEEFGCRKRIFYSTETSIDAGVISMATCDAPKIVAKYSYSRKEDGVVPALKALDFPFSAAVSVTSALLMQSEKTSWNSADNRQGFFLEGKSITIYRFY